MIFERDYQIRLNVSSPQSGHLYVLNEGEPAPDGLPSFNFLYPAAELGPSLLPATTQVQIPGKSWIQFDAKVLTEKLWLVWSKDEVPELEAVRGLANPKDRGAITRAEQLAAVRGFIAARKTATPEVTRDEITKRSTIRGSGDVLVHYVPLEHR